MWYTNTYDHKDTEAYIPSVKGNFSSIQFFLVDPAQRVREEGLKVVCVPTSFQARQLIVNNNLEMSDLEITPEVNT